MVTECGFATDGPEPCNRPEDHDGDCWYERPAEGQSNEELSDSGTPASTTDDTTQRQS